MIQENKTAEGLGMPWEDIYGYAQAVKKEIQFGFPVSWATTRMGNWQKEWKNR